MLNILSTCSNIVVLVEYSFSFCWSTTTHFVAKLKRWTRKCCCRLCFERCRRYYKASTKKTKKTQNLDARMVKKWNHIRCILHPVGITQKLWHFKLQKFPAYGYRVLRGASPVGGPILSKIYQISSWTLLLPTLQPPCLYFQETSWHQTQKRLVEAVQQAVTCWTE